MTSPPIGHLSWAPSSHLGVLLEDVERLSSQVTAAVHDGSTAPHLWDLAVIASCRLDGSAMTATPAPGDTTSLVDDDADPAEVMRREYAGVAAALRSDDIAVLLRRDPLRALPALHRALTAGLVATPAAGQLRRSHQVVHDGHEGRIVFRPVAPADIAVQLPFVQVLLAQRELHPVVTAGLVQFEVLRLHPFESANGRLARVAARMVLREAGLDPAGLAVAEIPLSGRRVGNYDVVAAALRSGDLTIWLETWAEDVTAGLRLAATDLGIEVDDVPSDVVDDLATRFTLVELRDAARQVRDDPAIDLDEARRIASTLADAGMVRVVSGTRGLRMVRGGPGLPAWYVAGRGIVGRDAGRHHISTREVD